MSKTLAEMTPAERKVAISRAVAAFQAELDVTADRIGEVLAEEPVDDRLCHEAGGHRLATRHSESECGA